MTRANASLPSPSPPLLTCSARLPVYALIIAAVIPNRTVGGISTCKD